MTVSIIIVNYNTANLLKDCIDSVNIYECDNKVEFIIVDNKSDDNQENIIDKIIAGNKNVRKVMLDKNYGFAYANNRGVELSTGEYILLLNPDVIFTECTFNKLINHLSDLNIGALGVKLYGNDNHFQYKYYQKQPSFFQYIFFYSVLAKPFIGKEIFERWFLCSDVIENISDLQSVSQIPGAFIFIRRNVYREMHGFKESYFLFFEDVDLCYRISKKYKLFVADIKVSHIGASSMKIDANYIYGYYVLSMLNFFRNNYSFIAFSLLKLIIFVNTIIKITIESIKSIFKINKPGVLEVHKYILNNLLK